MVFSTFDYDPLSNIHRHNWKEHLKISKPAKFKSDMSEVSEDIALQSRKFYRRWYGGGEEKRGGRKMSSQIGR